MRRSNTNRIPPQRRQLGFEPLEPRELLAADAGFDWWSDDWSWTFDDTTFADDSWTYDAADDAAWDDSWWVGDDSDASWSWEFDTTNPGWPTEAGGDGEWLDDVTTSTAVDVPPMPSIPDPDPEEFTPSPAADATVPPADAEPSTEAVSPEPEAHLPPTIDSDLPVGDTSGKGPAEVEADVTVDAVADDQPATVIGETDDGDVTDEVADDVTGDTADGPIESDPAVDADQSDEAPKTDVPFCGVPLWLTMPEFLTYLDDRRGESYPVHVDDVVLPVPGSDGDWTDIDDVTFDWPDVTSELDDDRDALSDPVMPSDAPPIVVTATNILPSTTPVAILPPSTVGTGLPGTRTPFGSRFAGLGGFFWQALGRQTGTVDGVAIGEAPSGSGRPRIRLPFRLFG